MRSQRDGGLSAITQVKVLSPEITIVALGQGFHFLEASIAACVKGEHVSDVPGSESMAGNRTVYIGTWENRAAPQGKPPTSWRSKAEVWRHGSRTNS